MLYSNGFDASQAEQGKAPEQQQERGPQRDEVALQREHRKPEAEGELDEQGCQAPLAPPGASTAVKQGMRRRNAPSRGGAQSKDLALTAARWGT